MEKKTQNLATVLSTGCHRRCLDASKMEKYLLANGYKLGIEPEQSHLNVLLTCAYCKNEEYQAMFMVNKLKRLKGKLMVLGCLPGISENRLKREFIGGDYLATKDFSEMDALFPDFEVKYSQVANPALPKDRLRVVLGNDLKSKVRNYLDAKGLKKYYPYEYFEPWDQSKGLLKISEGCTANCAYCSIRFATGSLKSKPAGLVLDEFRLLLQKGFKKIKISGEDSGAYGVDIGSSFGELLELLYDASQGFDCVLEVAELNPVWAVRHKKVIKKLLGRKFISSVVCPVQSGSSKLLKAMRRSSDVESTIGAFNEFREANPDFYFATHLILGFPGETEYDLNQTIDFIRRTKLNEYGVFIYSDRDGADSAKFKNKVNAATLKQRKIFLANAIKEIDPSIKVIFNT